MGEWTINKRESFLRKHVANVSQNIRQRLVVLRRSPPRQLFLTKCRVSKPAPGHPGHTLLKHDVFRHPTSSIDGPLHTRNICGSFSSNSVLSCVGAALKRSFKKKKKKTHFFFWGGAIEESVCSIENRWFSRGMTRPVGIEKQLLPRPRPEPLRFQTPHDPNGTKNQSRPADRAIVRGRPREKNPT